jgi:hypothetical protein
VGVVWGYFFTTLGRDNTQKHASKKHKGGMKQVGVLFGILINCEAPSFLAKTTNMHMVRPKNVFCGQDQFCDMPDADPTLPTHPTINQSAIKYQVRRAGTKTDAHGWPQQHSKLVILSKTVYCQCQKSFGKA